MVSVGVVSVGVLSVGVLSVGVLSIGVLSVGVLFESSWSGVGVPRQDESPSPMVTWRKSS